MAVDFSQLPEEVPVPEKGPSPLVWSLVFVALAMVGMAAVLWSWPQDAKSQTAWFWVSVTVIPACLAGALALRPFSHFHKRRNTAMAINTASKGFRNAVFDVASVPMAVLDAVYLLHAEEAENTFEAFLRRADNPPTRQSRHSREMIVASLLEPADAALAFDDAERQRATLSWILHSLLKKAADTLNTVPDAVPVRVRLEIQSILDEATILGIWSGLSSSVRPAGRAVTPVCQPSGGIWLVDTMLDCWQPALRDVVTFVICANLSKVRDMDPEPGSCESACLLVVCPVALADERKFSVVGRFHRPQASGDTPAKGALHYALKWGRVEAVATGGVVSVGLSKDTAAKLRDAGRPSDGAVSTDFALDTLLGNTGTTAPWLAATLALQQAAQSKTPYIVATQDEERELFAVLTPVAPEVPQNP